MLNNVILYYLYFYRTRGVKDVVFPILVLIVLMSCTLGMLISNCYKFYG